MHEFELQISNLKRFSEKKGVLLTIIDRKQKFKKLRELILQDGDTIPREHKAHITLMHPRNSNCDDKTFNQIKAYELPKKISVKKISLIEQELEKKWIVLKEYKLKEKTDD